MLGESPHQPSDRYRLAQRRACMHFNIGHNGHTMTVSCGEYLDGRLGEIFLEYSREGTFGKSMMHAFAMAVSVGLQHGVPLVTFVDTFKSVRMDPDFIRMLFDDIRKLYITGETDALGKYDWLQPYNNGATQ